VHPDDLRAGRAQPQPTTEPQEFVREYRLRRADGAYRWIIEHGAARFQPDGSFAGRIGSAMDITEHKLAEEEIKRLNENLERRVGERTEQLEAANRELEAFSYSVSHDLRAPLRAIDGFSRILLEDHAGQLDAEGRRVLDVIRTSAHRMAQLIDDLLAFSRFNRQPLAQAEIDMTALVHEVRAQIHAATVCPKCEWRIARLPVAQGDRALVAQVLANLLSNAIKYTHREGQPVIEVCGYERAGEQVYYVRDNGVGFDMRYADKLFDVFQRLHNEAEFEGTGVGLAIVKRIIERHGGRVWAEGRVGAGATFYFALPQTAGQNHARQAAGVMSGDQK
ncbi:MAG TPA: ATP-binding protein, partial [Pyrinomonadaceae bacterium]|nr:ATP-binding protein [Pyrinomonadaceae bacterium]